MVTVECAACGESFEAKSSRAKYCSGTCRTRGNRGAGDEPVRSGLVAETERELKRLGKAESVAGQQALLVAQRLVNPSTSGSAVAALSVDLSRLMAHLSRGAQVVDPVQAAKDEVARKRAQRATG